LISLAAFILWRRALVGEPLFRSEFIIEDVILGMIAAFGLAPARFKSLIGGATICSASIIAAIVVWRKEAAHVPSPQAILSIIVFTFLAVLNTYWAARELARLRKGRLDGAPSR
jgi:hypothetical protein